MRKNNGAYLACQRAVFPNCFNNISALCQRIARLEKVVSLTKGKKLKPFNATLCPSNVAVKITVLTSRVCRIEKLIGFKPKFNTFPGVCGGGRLPNTQVKVNVLCGRVARLEKLILA